MVSQKHIDVLKSMGFPRPTMANIGELSVKSMEMQQKLWEYSLAKHVALKEDKTSDITLINNEEQAVLTKIKQVMTVIILMRNAYRKRIGTNEKAKMTVLEKCADDPIYFVNYWCSTFDPRLAQQGLVSRAPFILFPKQEEVLKTLDRWYKNRLSGMVEKSREEGVSWIALAYLAWHFLFDRGFIAILGSQKEEKVDASNSLDTLFGKLRYLLYDLPTWFRPSVLAERGNTRFDKERLIVNPDRFNEIKGDVGDDIGRSGRASVVIIDEYQDIQHPEIIRNSVSSTSNCKIYIGTIKGTNHFYQLRTSGEVQVENIWWFDDPRKNTRWREGVPDLNSPWRKYLEATEDAVTIAQEHDGNPNASVEGSVIPAEWVQKAVEWLEVNDSDPAIGGFDVSTGRGNNEAVYIMRRGPVAMYPYCAPFKTPQECAWAMVNRGEEDGVVLVNYDIGGLGESLIGILSNGDRPIPFRLNGLRGNERASDEMMPGEGRKYSDKYTNKRAERYWALRKRFERTYEHRMGICDHPVSQMISIPNDRLLITQLSQPMIKEGVRLGVESKHEMKWRGVTSPDRADALVYAFSDYDDSDYVAPKFDYSSIAEHCSTFIVNHEHGVFEQYVSVFHDTDLSASVIMGQWWASSDQREGIGTPMLRVFAEIIEPNADPADVISKVRYHTRSDVYPIKEWVGNNEMFGKDWQRSPDRLYAREGVRLKKNYEYDDDGALIFMNQLLKNNQIVIHTSSCSNLIMQLSQWRRTKGRPATGLNLARAMCNMLTRLREDKKMMPRGIDRGYKTSEEWAHIKRKAISDYMTGIVK